MIIAIAVEGIGIQFGRSVESCAVWGIFGCRAMAVLVGRAIGLPRARVGEACGPLAAEVLEDVPEGS